MITITQLTAFINNNKLFPEQLEGVLNKFQTQVYNEGYSKGYSACMTDNTRQKIFKNSRIENSWNKIYGCILSITASEEPKKKKNDLCNAL